MDHRIRAALRLIGIILATSLLAALAATALIAFFYECARAKGALQVP